MRISELEQAAAGLTKDQLINSDINDELSRAYSCYGAAMRAFEEHQRLMTACLCEWDGGYGDDGSQYRRTPHPECPTHREEDVE